MKNNSFLSAILADVLSKSQPLPKRRIFISFDHADAAQVSGFLGLRQVLDNFEFYNHKLDYRINSADDEYVRRVIREDYIRPSSVTVVLIGSATAFSTWVQWEIQESISQEKGLLGIRLRGSQGPIPAGIPPNAVGGWDPDKFASWIEWAYQQRSVR